MTDNNIAINNRFFTHTDGELKGWSTFSVYPEIATDNDPCEDLMGPFYFRLMENGDVECMFMPTLRHNNNGGNTHGGALMTFADYALFAHSRSVRENGSSYVTLQFESQFIGASKAGIPLFSHGEITRTTRDLCFVRGQIMQEGRIILSYSGIMKKLIKRD